MNQETAGVRLDLVASAPDIVALLIVAVDQQGHAVTASQQLIGGSQCHTRLDIAGIDNEAVEAVVHGSHGRTVSTAASKAMDVHSGVRTALQNSAVQAQGHSAVLRIDMQVLHHDRDTVTDMILLSDIVDAVSPLSCVDAGAVAGIGAVGADAS